MLVVSSPIKASAAGGRRGGLDVPGTGVHENMVEKLESLKDNLVLDATELTSPDARAHLAELGFRHEKTTSEQESYVLGRAHLYGAGQRALLGTDGSCQLVTFADKWVQLTRLDDQGRRLSNAVERLP
ncbi:MAG: hypothetical protein AMXMBFR33_59470 [Candidatus Xenobia bacterium]